ncbi:hypothetical protein C5B96_00940 [Subtercola sp. Z020]|uniref:hypothetical protein n=1 Tax=Subtercola sp. Z020 TaxID=2080582 RepID=UPI000CE8B6A5|nr:hypothetical protein [Subtercola sp. Z020]PPF89495.1 hypothetical protein C5B96_00940 [Subtercola sp. Z020]
MTAAHPDPQQQRQQAPRRRRRRALAAAALVLLLFGVSAAVAAVVLTQRPPEHSALADATPGEWSSIPLAAPALNGDGSAYDMFVRPGSSRDLVVFFGDGGLNWNELTTAEPITPQSSLFGGGNFFYDSVPFHQPASLGGLLRPDAAAPFAASTIVYIPTTTGDLGVGDAKAVTMTSETGDSATADFNGYNNTRAALDWVYANVADPTSVLVAGAGTGGLNAAFWLGDVGAHYDSAPLFEYSDSSYVTAAALAGTIDPLWTTQFSARFGFEPTNDPLRAAVTHNGKLFGDRLRTLLSQTTLDRTLAGFSVGIDDGYYTPQAGADWNYAMKASFRAVTALDARTSVYVTDTGADANGETRHVISTVDAFQNDRQNGVTAEEWLAEAVQGGHPESVGADLLRQ